MKQFLILPVGSSQASLVQVKNTVLQSNLLEIQAIERYQHKHPTMNMEQAAMTWIEKNAARWRKQHSTGGIICPTV
ncbi:MAG: hypothetical protein IMZ61_10025 [Planctomycetes bacterium]|nr:hypothetical protein [Planctomycetota bacterium]